MPVYISSVPAHQADPAWTNITTSFAPYASKLIHKEMLLSELDMLGLDADQLELLDLLVMVQARAYVGSSSSLASRLVKEYRKMLKLGCAAGSRLAGLPGTLLVSCTTLL